LFMMIVEEVSKSKLKKIVAIVVGLIIVGVGVKLMQAVFTRASDVSPRDVIISEIATNSSKVGWSTGQASQAVIEYGTSPTSLNFFAPETQKTINHSVDLTLLSPETIYYFQIRIGDKLYDNGGVPWSFTTKGKNSIAPSPKKVISPVLKPTTINQTSSTLTPTPTPVSTVDLPEPTKKVDCSGTDCATIKAKLGKGCTTQEYFRCVRSTSTTPTATPSGAI